MHVEILGFAKRNWREKIGEDECDLKLNTSF
jgi:hypothetical protein